LTQWQRFAILISSLNAKAPKNVDYKLLFMGRHGEGYHNAAESYYGTPAWNCYWSLLDGNDTVIWADAHLTENGIAQAHKANNFWLSRINSQKIPTPQSYYTSPLSRCLATANLTFSGLPLPPKQPFIPTIKAKLREGISEHTCDRRSNKTYIAELFPSYKFESGFLEYDQLWTGVTTETSQAQDYRSKQLLDDVFMHDKSTYISFTSHSGEIGSILRILGHRTFSLNTGAVIPVLVKAETVSLQDATSTVSSATWTPSPHCTVPPATSVSGGPSGGCVCPNSAAPVTTTLPPFPSLT
jgi:broad specificity phosphatase PhoE